MVGGAVACDYVNRGEEGRVLNASDARGGNLTAQNGDNAREEVVRIRAAMGLAVCCASDLRGINHANAERENIH